MVSSKKTLTLATLACFALSGFVHLTNANEEDYPEAEADIPGFVLYPHSLTKPYLGMCFFKRKIASEKVRLVDYPDQSRLYCLFPSFPSLVLSRSPTRSVSFVLFLFFFCLFIDLYAWFCLLRKRIVSTSTFRALYHVSWNWKSISLLAGLFYNRRIWPIFSYKVPIFGYLIGNFLEILLLPRIMYA